MIFVLSELKNGDWVFLTKSDSKYLFYLFDSFSEQGRILKIENDFDIVRFSGENLLKTTLKDNIFMLRSLFNFESAKNLELDAKSSLFLKQVKSILIDSLLSGHFADDFNKKVVELKNNFKFLQDNEVFDGILNKSIFDLFGGN